MMDPRTRKALRRIRRMAKAWKAEGGNRKLGITKCVTFYMAAAVLDRAAEIIEEVCK